MYYILEIIIGIITEVMKIKVAYSKSQYNTIES